MQSIYNPLGLVYALEHKYGTRGYGEMMPLVLSMLLLSGFFANLETIPLLIFKYNNNEETYLIVLCVVNLLSALLIHVSFINKQFRANKIILRNKLERIITSKLIIVGLYILTYIFLFAVLFYCIFSHLFLFKILR